MAGGLDEEQAAVDAGILDVAFTLSSKLLAKVCGVLILDVLDNWVPASATSVPIYSIQIECERASELFLGLFVPAVVVDLVSVARCVDDVQAETHTVLLDDYSHVVSHCGPSRVQSILHRANILCETV